MIQLRHRALALAAAVTATATAVGGVDAVAHDSDERAASASNRHSTWTPPDGETQLQQAPALPGAQPISSDDRVYTADQTSNTVTVIDPSTNTTLGTLPLGQTRLDGALGPVDEDQVNVHGLGFSSDGRYLDVVSVTSNAVQLVDTATNAVASTTYVGRSPHEAFISPNGRQVWSAVRGQDHVSVVDLRSGDEIRRIRTGDGPSKVVFSPDGTTAWVNHLGEGLLASIDVATQRVTARLPLTAGGSADLAISPDGEEVWLGHPGSGKTTVVTTQDLNVEAVLETGPRTNHPNFVSTADGDFAWVTVGDLDLVKIYRRGDRAPRLDGTIRTSGHSPHGIWPSPDNTRVYVALQKSDSVDVIDTATRSVVATIPVGQDPQGLVYVARDEPGSAGGLSQQGLGERVVSFPVRTQVPGATASATVRNIEGLDEVDVTARGLAPDSGYDVYARLGETRIKLMNARTDGTGAIAEALAFVEFFDNGYGQVLLVPNGRRTTP